MSARRKPPTEPRARNPAPLVATSAFLLMSVASFWIPNENIAQTLRDSGVVSAIYCLAAPGQKD